MKIFYLFPLLLCYCSTTSPTSGKRAQVKQTRENNYQIKCATTAEGDCLEIAQARCGTPGYQVVDKKIQVELASGPMEYTYLTVSCR